MPKTKKISRAKRTANLKNYRRNKSEQQSAVDIDDINNNDNVIEIDSEPETGNNQYNNIENHCRVAEGVRTIDVDVLKRISNLSIELDDKCINAFLDVIKLNTSFRPQDTIFYQATRWYQRVESNKDIQILYGGDIGPNEIGHWTCVYYDGSTVHVYDTLHLKLLPKHHEILDKLYSRYSVKYEPVKKQPDGVSCGVFAAAIATSLALGRNPSTEVYFVDSNESTRSTYTLRRHLLEVLEQQLLIPFPTVGATRCAVERQSTIESDVNIKIMKTYASVCKSQTKKIVSVKEVESADSIDNFEKRKVANLITDKKVGTSRNNKTEWWNTHKDELNKKRREEYFRNQVIRRQEKNQKYYVNPEAKKAQEREKYIENPEPKKMKEREKYASNPEAKKTQEKQKYADNPEARNNQKKQKYADNPEAKKAQEKQKYADNPEAKKNRERQKYAENPEAKKTQEKKKYSVNPEAKKTQERTRYASDPDKKKQINKKYYYEIKSKKYEIKKYVNSNAILKKYRRLDRQRNTMKLLTSVEKSIMALTTKINQKSTPQSRIQAEKIVKWCLHVRGGFVSNLKKLLANTKRNAELCVMRAAESLNIEHKVALLCGDSKHTGSSEAYFADTAYNDLTRVDKPLIATATGKITNILPVCGGNHNVKQSWICDAAMCVKPDLHVINRLEHVLKVLSYVNLKNIRNNIKDMNICSVNNNSGLKLGHSESCYTNPATCKSKLLPMQILSGHYPRIRYFVRQVYEIIKFVRKINAIDDALTRGDLEVLKGMSAEAEVKAKTYKPDSPNGICLDEDIITSRYKNAFQALIKRSMDTPQLACVSCEKLCCRRDVAEIQKLRKPLSGYHWSALKAHMDDTGNNSGFICNYCLDKFRKGSLPATCVLNELAIRERPVHIASMNDYEKILIQRAKAFQTVQRMGTVIKKNMPQRFKVQKVKGRTFHLPLPLQETIKKLPSPTDAINRNHELFILVCGIPNKSKVVWSKLVDVKKVHAALSWLKVNNPLYKDIELPVRPESLLDSLTEDVEIQIEPDLQNHTENVDPHSECDKNESTVHPAMITQVVDSEAYCEQFTIYPIHEGRENKNDSALYQLLNVKEAPLSDWDKSLDVLCFPDLYPDGINGQHQSRTVHLRDCDYIKCRLMSKQSCFRLNQQYLFYLLHECNLRQLKAGIFHKMNVMNPRDKLNAGNYLDMMSKEQLEGNLTTVFARLRNTEQYWRTPRNNLRCMVESYGPASWFLTLSPSEWMWDDMAEYIRKVNGPEMARMSTSELVAVDPVSTSRYLDNKFHAMLSFICSSDSPIGEVTHYFWRREYQGRGMQHFHLLIWIKDAPVIGESSNDEVAQFITKYATCRLPDKNVSPTLYRRVGTHQRHRHNDYCLRNKKNKRGYSKVCRFGFPRPVTDKFVMRDVGISIAGRKKLKSKSRLYDLPRSEAETCINDYNPVILTAWEGNMDIQFIGEKSTLLNLYCTKYTTKAESSYAAEIINDINTTKSLHSRLWGIVLRSLANRDCGALEAADTLLGIPLYGTDPDTTIKWLDINQVRSRKIKSYKIVKALDPDSTDIFFPALIDDHYPNRPKELESVNLYDFARWYDITKVKPVDTSVEIYGFGDGLYLKRRQRPYLINHYKHNVNVYPEKYFYALLIMFKPWRDTDELKYGSDSYTESFDKAKGELMEALRYHERLADIQKGFDFIKLQIEKNLDDLSNKMSELSQESKGGEENPLGFQPVEADVAMQEFNRVEEQLEVGNIDEMSSKLNADQKRIFDHVTGILSSENNNEIMRTFVSGAGGTGKSFLIKTIRCWVKQILGKVTAVTAPTGLAAFNIDGLTIHRLFQLPIEHGGTPKYKDLSDQVLKILRQELKDVVLFIIDEVSMISNVTLTYIHLRLSEIFDTKNTNEGWFGAKHILLLGDLLQLPPVNDESAFIKLSKDRTQKYLGSLGMINLWSYLFTYDELTINMRQQDDLSYKEILDRVRFGIMTSNDIDILKSRQMNFVKNNINDRLEELCNYINQLPIDTVCLFSTRNQCDVLNTAMLGNIQSDDIELKAEDTVDCVPFLKKKISKLLSKDSEDSSRTAGLAKSITIKIGAKIMVRRNIDVTVGIVNGTIGHVTSVSRAIDTGEVKSLNIALASGKEYTIEKVSTKFEIMNGAFIFRKQFPVSLSYGITIHKSQGLSLSSTVMDIGNTVFTSGQAYVALSRVTSLKGLHLINLDPNSIKVQESALLEYNRLRQLYRPDLAAIDVSHKPMMQIRDIVWSINNNKLIQEIQLRIASTEDHDLQMNVVGIENNDHVSCYANATVQCLFHCEIIMRTLSESDEGNDDPLKILARSYALMKNNLTTLSVREFADQRFVEAIQQDAAEFLMALCEKSEIVRNAIEHKLITTIRCHDCGLTSERSQPNYIITLPINIRPDERYPKSLQDLVDRSLAKWTKFISQCVNCKNKFKLQKTSITASKEIVVIQLMLFYYENNRASKINNFKLNAIPTSKVLLDGKTFRVRSAIFHHGENTSSGHYTAMLKDNFNSNWLKVSDMDVRKTSWPRGAKDAYIFLLTKLP